MANSKPYYPILEGKLAENGITKIEIAKALGITPKALSNKLNGKRKFWFDEALTIARVFFPDISPDALFVSLPRQTNNPIHNERS